MLTEVDYSRRETVLRITPLAKDEKLPSGYLIFAVIHERCYGMCKRMTNESQGSEFVYNGEVGDAVIKPDGNGDTELRVRRKLRGNVMKKVTNNGVGFMYNFGKFFRSRLLAAEGLAEVGFGRNGDRKIGRS